MCGANAAPQLQEIRTMEQTEHKVQNIISADPSYRMFCDLPIVKDLRSRDRMYLFSCFEPRNIASGCEVYRAGQPSDQRMYLILDGKVSVTADLDTYTTLQTGDVFGLFSFLDEQRPHCGTVRADTDLIVLTLDKSFFNEVVFKDPALGNQILNFLFRLLSRMALKLESEYVAMHSLFRGGRR